MVIFPCPIRLPTPLKGGTLPLFRAENGISKAVSMRAENSRKRLGINEIETLLLAAGSLREVDFLSQIVDD